MTTKSSESDNELHKILNEIDKDEDLKKILNELDKNPNVDSKQAVNSNKKTENQPVLQDKRKERRGDRRKYGRFPLIVSTLSIIISCSITGWITYSLSHEDVLSSDALRPVMIKIDSFHAASLKKIELLSTRVNNVSQENAEQKGLIESLQKENKTLLLQNNELKQNVNNNSQEISKTTSKIKLVDSNIKSSISTSMIAAMKQVKVKIDKTNDESKRWTNKKLNSHMDKIVGYLGTVIADLKINDSHQQREITILKSKVNR